METDSGTTFKSWSGKSIEGFREVRTKSRQIGLAQYANFVGMEEEGGTTSSISKNMTNQNIYLQLK